MNNNAGRDSALLDSLTNTLSRKESVEKLTRPLLDFLSLTTGIQTVYFTHINRQSGMQHVMYLFNDSNLPLEEGMSVPFGETLCERAIEQRHFFEPHVDQIWADKQQAMQIGIKTYVSATVRNTDQSIYGTLCAISRESVMLSREKQHLFALCAEIISRQIEREDLVAELQADRVTLRELALFDSLTGLFNRRASEGELAQMLATARRLEIGVFFAFVDLDDFKTVNDTWGHEAGDALLTLFAQRLKLAMRKGDVVGRYGGDEFVAFGLLQEYNADIELEALSMRLEHALQGHYELPGHAIDYAGPSIGWAQAWGDDLSPEYLLAHADGHMYQVKQRRKQAKPD